MRRGNIWLLRKNGRFIIMKEKIRTQKGGKMMSFEKFVKSLILSVGAAFTAVGIVQLLTALFAREESSEEEKAAADCKKKKTAGLGILCLFLGGVITCAGVIAEFIDVEKKLDEVNPALSDRLRRADDLFKEYQGIAQTKLAETGNKSRETLDALREQAVSRWNEYQAAKKAAEI